MNDWTQLSADRMYTHFTPILQIRLCPFHKSIHMFDIIFVISLDDGLLPYVRLLSMPPFDFMYLLIMMMN